MKKLRKEFPVLQQYTYLNTASSGLLYEGLTQYRQAHDQEFLAGGSIFRTQQQTYLQSVKTRIKNFLKAPTATVALTPNVSTGFNHLMSGLDTRQKVLLLDSEYPSVTIAATSKPFEVCYATVSDTLEENILQAIQQHQPDIFMCSLVQYTDGMAIDVSLFREIKDRYPHLMIIVDGTQYCGTAAFNFDTSGIDILGASGYKWLLGGYGNGFLLFADDMLAATTPKTFTDSVQHSDYESSYTDPIARYECGHLDTLNFGSLGFSIDMLSTIGIEQIEAHIHDLTTHAKEELTKMQLLSKTVIARTKHSPIFNIRGDEQLYQQLMANDIISSLKGDGVRISLHGYNTHEELSKLFATLHRYC